jgi:hypothetical protein
MFDQPLIKACVQQQQMIEDLVGPQRLALDRDALADAVQLLHAHAGLLDRAQRRLLLAAGKGNHPESPGIGTLLTSLIQAALARGYLLKQAVGLAGRVEHGPAPSDRPDAVENAAHPTTVPVDRASDLDAALARLERLLALHQREWPWEPVPTAEEVLAADRTGGTQPAAEAFAQLAGLDVAAWEERVAEYRRRRARAGGG